MEEDFYQLWMWNSWKRFDQEARQSFLKKWLHYILYSVKNKEGLKC